MLRKSQVKTNKMTRNIISAGLAVILGSLLILRVNCQTQKLDEAQLASKALNRFALNMFASTVEELEAHGSVNLALSPFTIWSLLAIIAEGARQNTAREMDGVLGSSDKEPFRRSFLALKNNLRAVRSGDVDLDLTSSVFTTNKQRLNSTYENVVRNIYDASVYPVDFTKTGQAAAYINDIVAKATKNKVRDFVTPGDMNNADIVLTSTLYFKGMWGIPFNKTVTNSQPFFNEAGSQIGEVQMMYQVAYYPYTLIQDLNCWAVELPYGQEGKVSMIVLLPRQGERLSTVLQKLAKSSITDVIQKLGESAQMFEDENVQVYLPKFHVTSDLALNGVLKRLGINEVFDEDKANLLGMFTHYAYLTRVFQKADIAVDEDGTVATSAAGGTVSYKAPPPKFNANRPFTYFIVDKTSSSVIFMGTVVNPNNI